MVRLLDFARFGDPGRVQRNCLAASGTDSTGQPLISAASPILWQDPVLAFHMPSQLVRLQISFSIVRIQQEAAGGVFRCLLERFACNGSTRNLVAADALFSWTKKPADEQCALEAFVCLSRQYQELSQDKYILTFGNRVSTKGVQMCDRMTVLFELGPSKCK